MEWDAQCWAIVANKKGQGCVLEYGGGASLRFEIETICRTSLEDLGLNDAPDGLSVWEGVYLKTPRLGLECPQPRGKFRKLTDAELRLLANGHS